MKEDIIRLLTEYLGGRITPEHYQQLMDWVNLQEENREFFCRLCTDHSFRQRWEIRQRIDTSRALRNFEHRIHLQRTSVWKFRIGWIAAVAAGVVLLWVLTLFHHRPESHLLTEITPGSAKALLITMDGKKLDLGQQDSLYLDFGNASLNDKNKQLVYRGEMKEKLQYNELQVPRGGEYTVILSDGTVIRLNSGSSLRYPVAFGTDKREVVLQGEAYFEVTKNPAPFYVRMGEMTVRVYGTAFNLNGHKKNCIQVALVEGKIGLTVKGDSREYSLLPSQLAEYDTQAHVLSVQETDLSPYTAWTQGLFIFNNETLEEILLTLSRWYDVEVFYQHPDVQTLHFTGCVRRYEQMDQILKALSQSVGVKFRQQGRTLTVSY